MAVVKSGGNPAPSFRQDPWHLGQDGFDKNALTVSETLLCQANGYIGTRGTYEEPVADDILSIEGTFLNGVYLREAIHYDESACGFASHNNKMIMVPDAKKMRLWADEELLVQGSGQITSQTRDLHMENGLLEKKSTWQIKDGPKLHLYARRMVCAEDANLMAFEYEVLSEDFTGKLTLETGIDAAYGAVSDRNDPRAGALSVTDCLSNPASEHRNDIVAVTHTVTGSDHAVITAYTLDIAGATVPAMSSVTQPGFWGQRLDLSIGAGERLVIRKYVYYSDGPTADLQQLVSGATATLQKTKERGFDALVKVQTASFSRFWDATDIKIDGPADVQQGMRFNLFQLFQSAGRDGRRALGAKGLSGAGYDGHYFWDTEIYAVPFFVFNQPNIARALLKFRINTLDAARTRARQMGHPTGALFPWRTIGGEECSSFFPAGSAQYHINAAIAYALVQYVDATGDTTLLYEGGAELLFETARIWMQLGHFNPSKQGQFTIHEVTGPDEYSAMVDNNLYTNMMAQHHLARAAGLASEMANEVPDIFKAVNTQINLGPDEISDWDKAARLMYLPYDKKLGVHMQCDGFLSKPDWDFDETPPENYPLLLHYHPLVIYRHQVLKQADVVLAQILLSDRFDQADKARNLAYYEPRTTHDSTLSACIYSIANAETGDKKRAYEMFEETYRMDMENRHGNTHYGLHMACMAGSWMSLTYGFAGMRFAGGKLSFDPYLPNGWKEFSFNLTLKKQRLTITVAENGISYLLKGKEPLEVLHRGAAVLLTNNVLVTVA